MCSWSGQASRHQIQHCRRRHRRDGAGSTGGLLPARSQASSRPLLRQWRVQANPQLQTRAIPCASGSDDHRYHSRQLEGRSRPRSPAEHSSQDLLRTFGIARIAAREITNERVPSSSLFVGALLTMNAGPVAKASPRYRGTTGPDRLHDTPKRHDRARALPDDLETKLVQAGEARQVRAGEGSVRHFEVFRDGSV
jgi:hypothetical protein